MHRPSTKDPRVKALRMAPLSMLCALVSDLAIADPHAFDIAPQPLASALNRLAAQSGLQVIFDGTLVLGKNSPGVVGAKESEAALAEVLKGSGLTWRATGGQSVMLEKAPEPSTSLHLGETMITGQGMGQVTENSGSYTTGAVSVGSKTPTSLRYTPQSVSVLTQQFIEDKNITTLPEALRRAPGVTVQNAGSDSYDFYARGFNIDSIQIDGASPMALSSVASAFYSERQYNMLEFDHIEVLRGANALFGGVGDPGGTVNLVRKRALPDYKLSVEASAGTWDNYHSQIDVTGPLTENKNLRGRVAVSYTDRQYFADNQATQKPAIFGVLEGDISPDTTLTLGGFYERKHSNVSLGLPRYTTGADIGLPRHTSLGQNWSYIDNTSQEIFAKVDHYFANDWKLNVAYTTTHDDSEGVSAVTVNALNPVTLVGPTRNGSYNKSWSDQNLLDTNLSGHVEAFGREHEFVVGADYQKVVSEWRGSGVLSNIRQPVNVFDPVYWDPNPISKATPRVYSPNTQEQYGLYSRVTLQLADPFKLILGGRLARYHFKQIYTNAGVVQSDVDMREPTRFTPYAGAIYDLNDQWSLYGSYSKIFKPQQSYLKGPVGSGSVVDPMEGKTFEVGIKGELFDGALNTSAGVFYTKRQNGAVLDANYPEDSVLFGGSCCYLNQEQVISKGLELTASGELQRNWMVMASYIYNNNKNKSDGAALSTITPKHEVKLWTTYQLPHRLSDWTIGGGVSLQSATYVSGTSVRVDDTGAIVERNIPFDYSQSGYAVWDALVKYRVDKNWTVALNGNNLLDRTYYQTVSSAANGNYYGEPRNFTLTARGEF